MADQNEGARTLPVKFIDQGDGTVAERLSLAEAGDIVDALTQSTQPLQTAFTYFTTSDARNGLSQTITEERAIDGLTRTITITRDTSTGAITGQSATAWA